MVHRLSCTVDMRGLLGSGIKPMSPSLAGGFFTSEPPGKSSQGLLFLFLLLLHWLELLVLFWIRVVSVGILSFSWS